MWINRRKQVYFFTRKDFCFNLQTKNHFYVDPLRKEEWASNGSSTFIGPEELGGWGND